MAKKDHADRKSARARGYDTAWDRLAARYRREHPFCEECARRGYVGLMDEVDHIIPLVDGGARLDPENLQSLCWKCHKGWKRQIESFARSVGKVPLLLDWCKRPETRPRRFQN